MQIKIKSVRIIKEGKRKDQTPYKWLSVVADDGSEKGTEYTTFDQKALSLGPGSEIDIGDPKTKDNKLSFTKVVKVITEVPPSEIPQSNAKYHNGEYDQDRIDARAAFQGIIELSKNNRLPLCLYFDSRLAAEPPELDNFNFGVPIIFLDKAKGYEVKQYNNDFIIKLNKALDIAIDWAISKIADDDTVQKVKNPPLVIEKSEAEPEKQQSYIDDLEKKEFDNPGKLYYNADKYFNYKKPKVDEITVGLDLNNATDRKEAWRRIINEYACSVK